ncbi:MAG: NAD(P)/FAD-dependent oxidoreductase, partial [Anaerolineae bacterium]|nr:NAD(P)/FAD-dependent oxidoreductase [Anaerolineae bacterium]
MAEYDAVIVGSGPNGLAAAITLARAGCKPLVIEAQDSIGGGLRTQALTLPGFQHDVCSSIHPLGLASPFFRDLPLADYGLEWAFSPAEVAHPLDDGSAVLLERSVAATAAQLGSDAGSYRRLMDWLVAHDQALLDQFLGPLRLPRQPLTTIGFGIPALFPATTLAKLLFHEARTRALFAGVAAHAIRPLEHTATASFGLLLGMLGHAVGWPLARGGSGRIADALAAYLIHLGGEIVTGHEVRSLDNLPPARMRLFDVTPRQLLRIVGDRFPTGYRRQLEGYRYGPGVFKIDYALSQPIPWRAADCARAATVHVGGTLEDIARSEADAWQGQHSARPFTLLVQPTLFDPSRAPAGKHIAWAYCHVPHGSTQDMTAALEDQFERF